MRKFAGILFGIFICVMAPSAAFASASAGRMQSPTTKQAKVIAPALTDAERALVASSRQAIIQTGLSESYFDRHFTLMKAVNQSGDRRVVWKFAINGYETYVSDQLGYYTDKGNRVDIHSVATTLQATSEITRTISRKAANQIMQRCIGRFAQTSVEYRASGTGNARLVLTAESVAPSTRRRNERREREEREARERKAKSKTSPDRDVIEEEDDGGPPIVIGSIDLETGKCTKGQLRVSP